MHRMAIYRRNRPLALTSNIPTPFKTIYTVPNSGMNGYMLVISGATSPLNIGLRVEEPGYVTSKYAITIKSNTILRSTYHNL